MNGVQEYVGRATAAGSIAAVALLISAVLDAGLWCFAFLSSATNATLVYYLWLFAFVVCVAVFSWWFFESYRLLGMVGTGRTKHRPLAATLLPLIPIAGLFFAYSLLRELWRRTETSNVSDEPQSGRTPGPIKWAVFLSVAWYLFAASAGQRATHFESRAEAAGYYLWPFALGFAAKLAGRRIISSVSTLQRRLGSAPAA